MGLLGRKKNKEPKEEAPEVKEPPKEPEKKEEQPKGNFSLTQEEMRVAVTALADRPELKVYNDFIIGQQIAKIITDYNKAIGEDEELPTEDEGLPE